MMTNHGHTDHCCISGVSGQEMGLAYPCLRRVHDGCEAVAAADAVHVYELVGGGEVHEDYPSCSIALADKMKFLTVLAMWTGWQ